MHIETKPFKFIEIPIALGWIIGSVIFSVMYSLLFFRFWFAWLSWEKLQIPMGEAGAIYPVFFLPPVLLGSLIYQTLLQSSFIKVKSKLSFRFLSSLVFPIIIISVLLILFCPIEGQYPDSYVKEFFKAVFK